MGEKKEGRTVEIGESTAALEMAAQRQVISNLTHSDPGHVIEHRLVVRRHLAHEFFFHEPGILDMASGRPLRPPPLNEGPVHDSNDDDTP